MKKVAIVMGSSSDLCVVEKSAEVLRSFSVPFAVHVYSAHRTPEEARDFARSARKNGFGVIIAAAGKAAHLAGALAAIPCPVFIAPGNHDFYSPASPYASLDWPSHVHLFTSGEMEAVPLPELNCTVYGRAFTAPHQDKSPLEGFFAAGEGIRLGCLHGDVAPQSRYGPITQEEIAASGLHYLALGHIHQGSGLQRAGDVYWAYPGCPEGRGFDELGEKGVLYLEVDETAAAAQFIPLCRRRYESLTVDITGRSPLEAVRSALPAETGADIYRILFTGEGQAPDLAALEAELAPRFYGLTLRDRTRLPQDLWRRREEDTLTGLFLREMWQLCREEPDNPVYQMAARFGLAAMENGEDTAL